MLTCNYILIKPVEQNANLVWIHLNIFKYKENLLFTKKLFKSKSNPNLVLNQSWVFYLQTSNKMFINY